MTPPPAPAWTTKAPARCGWRLVLVAVLLLPTAVEASALRVTRRPASQPKRLKAEDKARAARSNPVAPAPRSVLLAGTPADASPVGGWSGWMRTWRDGLWSGAAATAVAGSPEAVRCELCEQAVLRPSATGVAQLVRVDVRALTQRWTTLKIRDATVRVTSLSPFGLQLRQPF